MAEAKPLQCTPNVLEVVGSTECWLLSILSLNSFLVGIMDVQELGSQILIENEPRLGWCSILTSSNALAF